MKIDELLSLYFTNEASDDQRRFVENWRDSNETNFRQFELLKLAWKTKPIPKIHINQGEVGEKVWNRYKSSNTLKRRRINVAFISKAAAVLLLFLTFAFIITNRFKAEERAENVVQKEVVTKYNARGVKSTIRLPDGSIVILNSESSISYSFNDQDSSRAVELKGEAFFTIKRDSLKPFVVRSGIVETRVLGTKFNVKSYPDDDIIEIALLEGKIKVITPSNDIDIRDHFLRPGQGLAFKRESKRCEIALINSKEKFGWKDGLIYFKNSSLNEVLSKLGRWYGVEFELINYSNQKWNYTAEYNDDYLDVILESMRFSQHFDYSISNKKVKIVFNKNESL